MTFRSSLPVSLVSHVVEMCGAAGQVWLDELPKTIKQLEDQWSIIAGEPFPAVEFNYVAAATNKHGMPVVLKIGPPFENNEINCEAKFLRHAGGNGAVRLVAEEKSLRAMLIERAIPGRNFAEMFENREMDALEPAIEILRLVTLEPPADTSDTISLDDWFDGMRRFESKNFPAMYGKTALELYDNIFTRSAEKFYLHGDFHPGNIVSATRAPYLAIDPKGIIGPIGYDIAVFLNNFHWWQETRVDVKARLSAAVTMFSAAFDIEPLVLRQWAFAQMVLSAWWTFDELPDIYDNEVAKANIWDL